MTPKRKYILIILFIILLISAVGLWIYRYSASGWDRGLISPSLNILTAISALGVLYSEKKSNN